MNDLELLVDLHRDGDRQGPGSPAMTLRALRLIDGIGDSALRVADIGCGNGSQTMVLAEHLDAEIIAVDIFQVFLQALKRRADRLGLSKKIKTLKASMSDLPLKAGVFDILWSEGAIYNMGFESGIKYWRRYLKPGGYLAVSDLIWTTNQRPEAIENYWQEAYSEISTASRKVELLEQHGYAPVGFFVLPTDCWTEHYYDPMEDRFDQFLQRHQHMEEAQKLVERERAEMDIYRTYKDYYGYGFFVARKIGK